MRGISKMALKAPFPWFGGKSRVAHVVWERFGNTVNYVEPFAGSLAVLLGRPGPAPRNETVNDRDCFISNFWRAVQHDPEAVAHWANWPVNEADLHARHQWLHQQEDFISTMHSDPDHYDVKIAGWWVWGISLWIGGNWCAVEKNGVHAQRLWQGRPNLNSGRCGVQLYAHCRRRPQSKAGGSGIHRRLPDISGHGGASGRGVHAKYARNLEAYMIALRDRLRMVRVCCGDWTRILGPSPTVCIGMTAVFLDPPYGDQGRDAVYNHDSYSVAGDVRTWCVEHSNDKKLRIALCGYEGEHNELEGLGWSKVAWSAGGGYGARNKENQNRKLERIWFSPACLDPAYTLFDKSRYKEKTW